MLKDEVLHFSVRGFPFDVVHSVPELHSYNSGNLAPRKTLPSATCDTCFTVGPIIWNRLWSNSNIETSHYTSDHTHVKRQHQIPGGFASEKQQR